MGSGLISTGNSKEYKVIIDKDIRAQRQSDIKRRNEGSLKNSGIKKIKSVRPVTDG